MKKTIALILVFLLSAFALSGCASQKKIEFKIGMATDSSDLNDGGFNEDTWAGIERAAQEMQLEYDFFEPGTSDTQDLVDAIATLYDSGCRLIILPGGSFGSAAYEAQYNFEDAKFVIIDGMPNPNDPERPSIGENTVAVSFNAHEAGFIAGVATAVELKDAELGFIGGMPLPSVQQYSWGFQQGVVYANENYGVNCLMSPENWIYQGTFHETEAGKALASQMFDRGVKAIFCVAGAVGMAAMEEAKSYALNGQEVYVIGVDFDQYERGIYKDNKSVVLTSAKKRYGQAAYDMIMAVAKEEFPGGQEVFLSGGIPRENLNLGEDAINKAAEVSEKIKSGDIIVSKSQGDLLP